MVTYSSLNEDVLGCCASGTNTVDTSLVQFGNESVRWLIVELIVAIEDDVIVRLKRGSKVGPECLEITGAGEDRPVISTVVVGIND